MKRVSIFSRLVRRWHKQIGVFAALFFVFLACTGLLLNHGDLIDLDKTDVKTSWLMQWYGLKTEIPEAGFRSNGAVSAFNDRAWVMGGKAIASGHGDPIGVVAAGNNYWVATSNAIAIYQRDGQLVDRVEANDIPSIPIRRLGAHANKAVIDTTHGTYESSDGLAWNPTNANSAISWSHAEQLSQTDKASLSAAFAPSLPALRIVSDLHSGNIWGRCGVLVTDAIALALLLLAFTGVWIYVRIRLLRRSHAEQIVRAHQQY